MADFFATPFGIFILVLAQTLAVVAFVMISLLFLVYGDRKIWAAVQMRRGPNVVGVFGILQSVADALKYILKEVVIPAGSDKAVFLMAPIISFVCAMIAWAAIPFNDGWVLADINVAILYVMAISSLEVYGVIMVGFEGQHDQCVDAARRHHVLDVVDLLARIRGRGEHEIELRIDLLEPLDGLLRVEVHAARPAMGRRGDGHADHLGLAILRQRSSSTERQGRASGQQRLHVRHFVSSLRLAQGYPFALASRCKITARMMMTPWIAPLR